MEKLTDSYIQPVQDQDNVITQFKVDRSTAVADARKGSQEIAIEKRNSVTSPDLDGAYQSYKESVIAAQAVDKPAGEGVERDITLTADDDFLPYLSNVEGTYDMKEQQYQDDQAGVSRPPGQISNQYLLPGRKTIMGVDVANDRRIMNRGDESNGKAQQEYQSGREWVRKSNFTQGEGYDEKGLTGFTHIATGVLEEGGDKAAYDRAINMMGVPPEQARLAWNAAVSSRVQEDLAKAIVEDNYDTSQVEPPVPEDINRADLPQVPMWADAVKHVYEVEEGRPWEGNDDALIEYYTDMMTAFNWKTASANDLLRLGGDMTEGMSVGAEGMAYWMVRSMQEDQKFAQAFAHMIDTYERVNTDLEIVAESAMAALSDPLNLVSMGGGKLAMTIAGKVAKEKMKHWLTKGAVIGAGTGAVEGGVYSAADNAARQQIDVEAGYQEEIDKGQVAAAGGLGTVAGTVLGTGLGVAMPLVGVGARRAGRTMWENGRKSNRMSPMRAQIGAVGNVGRVRPFQGEAANNVPGGDKRLATRLPIKKVKGETVYDMPNPQDGSIGITNLEQTPVVLAKQAEQIKAYDNFRPSKDDLTDAEVVEEFKQHIVDNLLYLHDKMEPALRDHAKQWYDGARKQVDTWSEKYGLEEQQVAAVIANLSPQKDWFMNMSLAERMMDIYTEQMDTVASIDMGKQVVNLYSTDAKGNKKKSLSPGEKAAVSTWEKYGEGKTLEEVTEQTPEDVKGLVAAQWIRAYDEVNNPRHHRVIAPDGSMMDYATNAGGERSGTGWGSYVEISKAFNAMNDPDLESISRGLGNAHKVRNFYNNIVSPKSNLGEVTIDTHAVAAGLIKPLSGGSHEVSHNFGSAPQKKTFGLPPGWERQGPGGSGAKGISGTYGIFADAYREAAEQRGILPREMQSITWEEIRTIFTPGFKSDEANIDAVNKVWREYKDGTIGVDEARKKVEVLADVKEGRKPAWARSSTGSTEEGATSTYREELPGGSVPRQGGRGGDGGRGADGNASTRASTERVKREKAGE